MHEFARLVPKAREPLGGSGGMLPRKILKTRVSLMAFPAFWCGFLCMEQVTNEENIKNISETKHEQEDCPTLK